jgi:hypothetical protein
MTEDVDTVLVACPTYSGLATCLDEYLAAYAALRWGNKRLMIVDNTKDDGEYARLIRPKVEAVGGLLRRIEPSSDWDDTFGRAWGVILQHARWNAYRWVFSLEQDVIVPPLTLDTLLNVAGYIKAPLVLHTYPYHGGKPGFYQGLGCTLMSTDLLGGALDVVYKRLPFVEAAIFDVGKRNSHAVLHQLLDIKHRDDTSRHWDFVGTTSDEIAVGIE